MQKSPVDDGNDLEEQMIAKNNINPSLDPVGDTQMTSE
jgi:hypothetical protein